MRTISNSNPLLSTKDLFGGLLHEFFNNDISTFLGSDLLRVNPAVNVLETDESWLIELAAPGFEKSDFSVKVEDKALIVHGNRKSESRDANRQFMRREFAVSDFERHFTLPDFVNKERLTAVYENGVLVITLPKVEEAKALTKVIEVG